MHLFMIDTDVLCKAEHIAQSDAIFQYFIKNLLYQSFFLKGLYSAPVFVWWAI